MDSGAVEVPGSSAVSGMSVISEVGARRSCRSHKVKECVTGRLACVGQAVVLPQLLEHQAIEEDLVEERVVTMLVDGEWTEEVRRMGMRQRSGGIDRLGHG